ncbi:MAG: MnhB domain-containing protein [Candidatus Omnitrophica bacterium]|nr:MnhB domain-containing protein [Candidatus Omnitrophota bacterium]MDD5592231.1 MnhB domain-containing protein [Candidatus Omnitrophota bacterium]
MENKEAGMGIIVKTITRLTIGLIFIYGIYVSLHGHMRPGGGFAGGLIIALSFIHVLLAFGKDVALKKLNQTFLLSLMALAAAVVLLILISRPANLIILSLCDIAICFTVGAGLFIIFLALALIKKDGA